MSEPQVPDTSSETRGRRLNLSLSSLYLDPNNYRFIDHADYRVVEDERITDDEVQRRTRRILIGQNADNVSDLIASFSQNGWLDVEPIHVRKLAERKYLVVEGNRRVATLKHIQSRWEDATGQLGNLSPSIFSSIPCIQYDETDEIHHLVVMGLHHISGKRRWPALNQARLMKRLRDDKKIEPDTICASLGVSKRAFNLSLRTLALVEVYRKSDYGDQFSSDMFNLFQEVLKAPSLRDWLGWNNDTERAEKQNNLERLFSWLSREPEPEEEGDESASTSTSSGEAVITTGGQIRELAKIIGDPEAVKRLEETRSLQAASLSSDMLVKNEIEAALERSNQDIGRLFQLASRMSSAELDRIDDLTAKLEAVAVARKREPPRRTSERAWQVYSELVQSQFSSLKIDRYRGLSNVELTQLGRVNLIVGVNNAGKTSLLEAVYLLAHQSDPRALLEVLRRRTRVDPAAFPEWSVDQWPTDISLEARFDSRPDNLTTLRVDAKNTSDDTDEDWASYLRTLVVTAGYAGRRQRSTSDFFAGRARRTRVDGEPRWLCQTLLHSPFSLADPESLTRCNEASIREKSKDRVLEFIREHLDPGITDIALANEHNRFLVTHSGLSEAVDLSVFGEGIQRVFQIGLMFAGVRGGVLLIDEFENALHTSVLYPLTTFIKQLAADFNVQVFITTHSKETIEAFLRDDFIIDDVVAHLLKRSPSGGVEVRRFEGPKLKRGIEIVDLDIRRL